jgi:hypothetical protein
VNFQGGPDGLQKVQKAVFDVLLHVLHVLHTPKMQIHGEGAAKRKTAAGGGARQK